MKILLVNRHFAQEHVPTGRMLADLARTLCENGHQVSVINAKSSYVETIKTALHPDLITVTDVPTFGEKYRLVSWLVFLIQAWGKILFTEFDKVVLLTDPPFLATVSIILNKFKRNHRKTFWWMMDLYPEILFGSGRVKENNIVYRFLLYVNELIIECMGGFILLGECQREHMIKYKRWRNGNYIIVPPWDFRKILPVKRNENRFVQKYKFENKKIALYAGNLGEGHIFMPLVDLANILKRENRNDWVIVFVVRGSRKQSLKDALKGVENVHVLDYQPEELTADLLFSAHVHLITMQKNARGLVVPSKLYGALGTGAPILFIGPTNADTAAEIARYGAGMSFAETESSEKILSALDNLYKKSNNGSFPEIFVDKTGPQTIADFICQ